MKFQRLLKRLKATARKNNRKDIMKKIRSWSLVIEWEHSDKTWSTELLGQGDMDKLTFKNIEKYLKNHAKIENKTERT